MAMLNAIQKLECETFRFKLVIFTHCSSKTGKPKHEFVLFVDCDTGAFAKQPTNAVNIAESRNQDPNEGEKEQPSPYFSKN